MQDGGGVVTSDGLCCGAHCTAAQQPCSKASLAQICFTQMARSLRIVCLASLTTCLVGQIRDPRVKDRDSQDFLNMMERYFEQTEANKKQDARPELHYQVPVTDFALCQAYEVTQAY